MADAKPYATTYEALAADMAARGLDHTDLLGADGHYDRWMAANGLTAADGTPQELYARYEADPDGAEACPPHANVWHHLLRATKGLAWEERPGERSLTLPICTSMFAEPEDLTPERIAEGRRRLEEDAGAPIPEDVWRQFEREARKGPAAGRRCVQELRTLLERHGTPHADFGHMMLVTLKVDC